MTPTPVMVSTLLPANASSITGRAESPISEPTCGLWSTRITRGVAPDRARPTASSVARWRFRCRSGRRRRRRRLLMAGSAVRRQAAKVPLQSHRAVVGVDVETELGQPGNVRLDHACCRAPARGGRSRGSRRQSVFTVAAAASIPGDVGGDMAGCRPDRADPATGFGTR